VPHLYDDRLFEHGGMCRQSNYFQTLDSVTAERYIDASARSDYAAQTDFSLQERENFLMPSFVTVRVALLVFLLSMPYMHAIAETNLAAAAAPKYSVPHGFYSAGFDLTISSSSAGAVIRFTMDGSDPRSSSTAAQMSSPAVIRVDPETTYSMRGKTPAVVVRACGVAPGLSPSAAITNTYVFVHRVAALSREGATPGPGWPTATTSGDPQSFDYGMSPTILNDARYKNLIDTALMAVPSISIATDLKNLFSADSGIYVNASMDGKDWERPASIELLRNDHVEGFQIDAGLRIRGGWSRHGDNPKHAFRLFFKSEYGKGKLDYPLFEREGVDKFDKVDLRTAQNYAWSYPGHDGRNNTFISEVFCRDLQREMGQAYTRSRFYHLYLNGVYWGLFQTQERAEAKFAASYFGGSSDDYDVIKNSETYTIEATDGTLDSYQEVWNACVTGFKPDSNYFNLFGRDKFGKRDLSRKVLVNVENLIDYMLVIFYSGNFDAPLSEFRGNIGTNNFYAIYNRKLGDGYRFFVHDAEHTLRTTAGEGPGIGLNENRVNIGTRTDGNKMMVTDFQNFQPQWLHFRLSDNAEYRISFADHAYKHFFNQGCMTPAKASTLFRSRASEIDMAIIAESARWGNTYLSPAATKDNDWKRAVDDIVNNYFPYRHAIVLNQLRQAGLYPAIDPPGFLVNGDALTVKELEMTPGAPLLLQVPLYQQGSVFYTRNGDDPRMIGGAPSVAAVNAGAGLWIAADSTMTIKARVLNGTVWSALHELRMNVKNGTSAAQLRNNVPPVSTELLQNYPNPFNPSTTIRYTLAHAGRVTLTVYNTLGETVEVLIDGTAGAGAHRVMWDASRYASGIYYCKMIVTGTETAASVQKLLLMK
jgi:hypothetical protein